MKSIIKFIFPIIFRLGNVSIVKKLLFHFQGLLAQKIKKSILELDFVEDVYLKGSIKEIDTFQSFLSDIDLVIVTRKWNSLEELETFYQSTERKISLFRLLFPPIDIDIYSLELLELKFNLSQNKSFDIFSGKNIFIKRNIFKYSDFITIYSFYDRLTFYLLMKAKNAHDFSNENNKYDHQRLMRTEKKLCSLIQQFIQDLNSTELLAEVSKNILISLQNFSFPKNATEYSFDGKFFLLKYFPDFKFELDGVSCESFNKYFVVNSHTITDVRKIVKVDCSTFQCILKLGVLDDSLLDYQSGNDFITPHFVELINSIKRFHRQQIYIQSKQKFQIDTDVKYFSKINNVNKVFKNINIERKRTCSSRDTIFFALFNISTNRVKILSEILDKFVVMQDIQISVVAVGNSEQILALKVALNKFEIELITLIEDSYYPLWQKESLYNLAAFYHILNRSYTFLDSDCYPLDLSSWCKKLLASFDKKARCFQVYEEIVDPININYEKKSSFSSLVKNNVDTFSHGLGWAILSDFWHKMKGFPTIAIEGSNDTLFVLEHLTLDTSGYSNWLVQLLRDNQEILKQLHFIDETFAHVSYSITRNYKNRSELLDNLPDFPNAYYRKNEFGLNIRTFDEDLYQLIWKWSMLDYIDIQDFNIVNKELTEGKYKDLFRNLYNKRNTIMTLNNCIIKSEQGVLINVFSLNENFTIFSHSSSKLNHEIEIVIMLKDLSLDKSANRFLFKLKHRFGDYENIGVTLVHKDFANDVDSIISRRVFRYLDGRDLNFFQVNHDNSLDYGNCCLIYKIRTTTLSKLSFSFFSNGYNANNPRFTPVKIVDCWEKTHCYNLLQTNSQFVLLTKSDTSIVFSNSISLNNVFEVGISIDIASDKLYDNYTFEIEMYSSRKSMISAVLVDPSKSFEEISEISVLTLNPGRDMYVISFDNIKIEKFNLTIGLISNELKSLEIFSINVEMNTRKDNDEGS